MTWARIDDTFHHHPKPMSVSLSALGLFALGLSYAADNGTRGQLPEKWVLGRIVGDDQSAPQQLVEAGLWRRTESGYEIHDYHDYNLTPEQVEERRSGDRDRKQKQRGKEKESRRDSARTPGPGTGLGSTGSGQVEEAAPESLRPILADLDAVAFSRGLSVKVSAAVKACEKFSDRDLAKEADKFRHYWVDGVGSNRRMRDVVARWRNWLDGAPPAAAQSRAAKAKPTTDRSKYSRVEKAA